MADIVNSATRSRMMSSIRGANTKPEMVLRRLLHASGLRYRLFARELPGKPDLVFSGKRAVVFVNGCFWHRHEGCHWCTVPATNASFWKEKFESNVARDIRNTANLHELGWRVATVWECALKGEEAERTSRALQEWLESERDHFETQVIRHRT
ncbi:MAG: very short patch repair endonuclease [Planctomycetota bacterium]